MAMTWDLTDVPAVEVADLAAVMRALIDDGRGLVVRRMCHPRSCGSELKRQWVVKVKSERIGPSAAVLVGQPLASTSVCAISPLRIRTRPKTRRPR